MRLLPAATATSSPLRMRIKARAAPGFDAPTAHSLRRLSERKLHSPRCSLVKAILIQNALPLLNCYDAELLLGDLPADDYEPLAVEHDAVALDAMELDASDAVLDTADDSDEEDASLVPASPPAAEDRPLARVRAVAARRRGATFRQRDLDHDVDLDLGLDADDSGDSDEGDGVVFEEGPASAPFDEFDDVFDILDARPPSTTAPASQLDEALLPSCAKRSASVASVSSCCDMDATDDFEDADDFITSSKRAKRQAPANACATDHMGMSKRAPLAAIAYA